MIVCIPDLKYIYQKGMLYPFHETHPDPAARVNTAKWVPIARMYWAERDSPTSAEWANIHMYLVTTPSYLVAINSSSFEDRRRRKTKHKQMLSVGGRDALWS